ncbi:hypothetical protein GALMADRAFT_147247 [Galerina marginata CBS 339.88]|uniref:DUF5648 domain-containing protein n=1 Tax=Galerina marginata (strain CBS 339.88) TaxID=685588 RepID=A0A067S8T4_GALM3|nr:hypothetical protein GALMADRAFT_147247 [Galerina marginata CBS 339.88]
MKFFSIAGLVSLFLGHILVMGSAIPETRNPTVQSRAANSCGDTTAATVYYTAFSLNADRVHGINTKAAFADGNTRGTAWETDSPVFGGWTAPGQLNTVPLYAFGRIATVDFVYIISTNGNPPPTPSGFNLIGILGYVYPTQICGSVPLYGASLASPTDHWYTTQLNEHDAIVSVGWTDLGITAYVLPVDVPELHLEAEPAEPAPTQLLSCGYAVEDVVVLASTSEGEKGCRCRVKGSTAGGSLSNFLENETRVVPFTPPT